MKTILFIGPAPQNIGGISMHIRRLVQLLNNDIQPDFIDEGHKRYFGVFNFRSKNLFKYFQKIYNADIVHIHSGIWMLRAFHIIICKIFCRKKTIVTVHRNPIIEPHTQLTKFLLKYCDHAILVNKEGYNAMSCECKCHYHLQPAFIPPTLDDEPMLPDEVTKFISKARSTENNIILCSNAWNLVLYDGVDLYGLDMCIEAMGILISHNPNYYLIFVVASNTSQQEKMSQYKKTILDNQLENNILIWEQPTSFVRLIEISDIMLRTTNTDGDAISIREALFFDKPVIASDVVARPEGTLLFRTRSAKDLVEKIMSTHCISSHCLEKGRFDYRGFYLNLYNY